MQTQLTKELLSQEGWDFCVAYEGPCSDLETLKYLMNLLRINLPELQEPVGDWPLSNISKTATEKEVDMEELNAKIIEIWDKINKLSKG